MTLEGVNVVRLYSRGGPLLIVHIGDNVKVGVYSAHEEARKGFLAAVKTETGLGERG